MMMSDDAQKFQQALAMAQGGQRFQANTLFGQLLQANPANADALIWYAYTSSDPNQAHDALTRVAEIASDHPQLPEAQAWLAQWQPQFAVPAPQSPSLAYQSPSGPPMSYQSGPAAQSWYLHIPERKLKFGERWSLGWSFIMQAFNMAREDRNLLKPALYALGLNIIATLVVAIPLLLVASLTKNNVIYYVAVFLAGLLSYFITYYHIAMTVKLVHQKVTSGQSNMPEARQATNQKIVPILGVATISAFIYLLRVIANSSRGGKNGSFVFVIVARIALALVEAVWTLHTYFIIPVIMIEHLGVGEAVHRSTRLIKHNLLQVGVGFIGVGLVTGLLGFVAFLGLAALSLLIFFALNVANTVIAIIVALLIFIGGISLVGVFTSYLRTAYYTLLVMWARETEKQGSQALPPAPLRTVLQAKGFATVG